MSAEPKSNIPAVTFENLFEEDPVGEKFFEWWLGTAFLENRRHFLRMGEMGAKAAPLSARADKKPPELLTHDATGERVNRVTFHPDYHELMRMSYGEGIVALKYDAGFLSRFRANRHAIGFGASYYFGQTESGLFCPVCMTDGAARVLEIHGKSKQAKEALAHLTTRNMDELWQGAMFLTERQGGSDVGANRVIAYEEHGRWFLNGDKWFCSNVSADAILALARMPSGPEGTKGLGLFLVLRKNPPKNEQTILIHRLKDKLGVRSMATGEVTFQGTEAFLIGGIGEGFKMMADMLNTSRLYNAIGSIAAMRRSTLEALAYGARREAFGKPLWSLPLWRATMADMVAEQLGAFCLTFEAVRALDRADQGDEEAKRLVRVLVPLAKLITAKQAVLSCSEAMEAIGGNGYIEENIMPRLLRDAQVLPIWEGTTSVLTLDVMRANRKDQAYKAFFSRVQSALAAAKKESALSAWADDVRRRVERDQEYLMWLAGQSAENEQRGARQWVESAARTFVLAMLLEAATHPPLASVASAAYRRLAVRPFGGMISVGTDAVALADTETELLRAGYRPREEA